jgi:hypothetical protein
MAWTTPRTYVTGEVVTAAILNADVRDNLNALRDPPGARVFHNTSQNATDSAYYTLAFNSESYDNDVMHDNVTNNSRLTVKTAGKYAFYACVELANAVNDKLMLRVLKNGVTVLVMTSAPDVNVANRAAVASESTFAVNDYIQTQVYQSGAGGVVAINYVDDYSPVMAMRRVAS